MKSYVSKAALAIGVLLLAGCAGKPASPPIHLTESDPHSTNPDRIICRQMPPPTGSHIQQDAKVCHTWSEWQQMEKYSQDAIRRGQHMPGAGGGATH